MPLNAMNTQQPNPSSARRDVFVAFVCGGCVAAMIGLSFAAVPFYSWCCGAIGYGGSAQVAKPVQRADQAR